MGLIGGALADVILRRYEWNDVAARQGYAAANKLEILFGPSIWEQFRERTILDFGCGHGQEAIEIAQRGAKEVIGLDLREDVLETAREHLAATDLRNCRFATTWDSRADVILSVDSFEHFDDPGAVLEQMSRWLQPDGRVVFSFGPPWLHPLGGHLPLFPWAHLLLTERALMKWRSKYKNDGARRFREVAGGLNQMTIGNFERVVENSPLRIESMQTVPIRAARPLHNRLTREFLTSVVRGSLVQRGKRS